MVGSGGQDEYDVSEYSSWRELFVEVVLTVVCFAGRVADGEI